MLTWRTYKGGVLAERVSDGITYYFWIGEKDVTENYLRAFPAGAGSGQGTPKPGEAELVPGWKSKEDISSYFKGYGKRGGS
jgi:hypothetical protein